MTRTDEEKEQKGRRQIFGRVFAPFHPISRFFSPQKPNQRDLYQRVEQRKFETVKVSGFLALTYNLYTFLFTIHHRLCIQVFSFNSHLKANNNYEILPFSIS